MRVFLVLVVALLAISAVSVASVKDLEQQLEEEIFNRGAKAVENDDPSKSDDKTDPMMESVVSNENKQEDVMEDGNKAPEANDDDESMNLFSRDDDDDDLDALRMLQAISEQDDDSEGNDNADSVAVAANDLDKKKAGNNKVKAQFRWRIWPWFRKVVRRVGRKTTYAGRLSYRLRGRGGKGGLPDYSDYGQPING